MKISNYLKNQSLSSSIFCNATLTASTTKAVKVQSFPSIAPFAKSSITEGTMVQTDSYHSYRKPLAEKYLHEYQVFDADSDMLKWLHIIVSNTKAFVSGTFHGLGKKHLQSYLDEYCYRFNRSTMGSVIFDRLLLAVTQSAPLRFADLT